MEILLRELCLAVIIYIFFHLSTVIVAQDVIHMDINIAWKLATCSNVESLKNQGRISRSGWPDQNISDSIQMTRSIVLKTTKPTA